jgi:hypothetical protein
MSLSRISRFLLYTTLLGSLVVSGLLVVLYINIESKLPSIEVLKEVKLQEPLRIFSSDRKLLAEYGDKRRTPVTIEQVPQLLVQAFLAAEDDRFFEHSGVDFPGLLRAVVELIMTGEKRSGGSTITMQVARNFFLSTEKTYLRKLTEILLSFRIEHSLSKDEILELYLSALTRLATWKRQRPGVITSWGACFILLTLTKRPMKPQKMKLTWPAATRSRQKSMPPTWLKWSAMKSSGVTDARPTAPALRS